MLAVVNQPHIRIEAPVIPSPLLSFLKKKYGKVTIVTRNFEYDEQAVPFSETSLYKETFAEMTPSENLKLLRKNRGFTQKMLADKCGFAVSDISGMERNIIPICQKSAKKLSEALGTSLKNLFW